MCSPRAVKMIGDVVVVIYVGDGFVQCRHYKRSMVFQGLVSSHVIFSFKFTKVCKYVLKTGVGFEEPVNEKQVICIILIRLHFWLFTANLFRVNQMQYCFKDIFKNESVANALSSVF